MLATSATPKRGRKKTETWQITLKSMIFMGKSIETIVHQLLAQRNEMTCWATDICRYPVSLIRVQLLQVFYEEWVDSLQNFGKILTVISKNWHKGNGRHLISLEHFHLGINWLKWCAPLIWFCFCFSSQLQTSYDDFQHQLQKLQKSIKTCTSTLETSIDDLTLIRPRWN